MQFVLMLVAVAAAVLLDVRASQAYTKAHGARARIGAAVHLFTIAACEPSNSASQR